MAGKTRDLRITLAVPCAVCGVAAGTPCRNPIPHQGVRGPQDRRPQPVRPHNERRADWVEWRKTHE